MVYPNQSNKHLLSVLWVPGMVLGTEDIEMKEPLKCLFGGREQRARGLIGAPEEKPVPLFLRRGS